MYRVYCDGELIYNTRFDDKRYILHDAKLDLELNKAGSFDFIIYPSHAKYNIIYPLKPIITVYQDDYLIFRGRVLNTIKGFYNEKQVLCEGELAFLCDSVQRPYDFLSGSKHTTIEELFTFFIENHNRQVDESKQFKIGNVSVTDENDYIVCSNENLSVTWNAISEKLIEKFGGYLWIRHEEDGNYIDYISDFSTLGNQPVKFGKNLLSIKRENRGEDIATALIPIGANGITIKKVNDNIDYIYDAKAVEQYGWIFRTETWEDVTLPSNLLAKAQKRLKELSTPLSSIEISAADLSSVEDFDAFRLGTYVRADSSPHDLNEDFIVKKLQITLAKPSANKLTLDGTFESFTQTTNAQKSKAQNLKAEVIESTNKSVEAAIAESESRIMTEVEKAITESEDSIGLEITEFSKSVNAKLDLAISVNEDGVVQSVIGASADTIKFESNKLIIDSTNFALTEDGTITANAGQIGSWRIEQDGNFREYVIRNTSPYFKDTLTCTTNGADMRTFYNVYIFTVLSSQGLWYVVKDSNDYTAGSAKVLIPLSRFDDNIFYATWINQEGGNNQV